MEVDVEKLLALPPSERIKLAEMLWDSIGNSPDRDTLPLTAAQQSELDRRLDECPDDDDAGTPAREALRELRRRIWPDG
jgi:putative addiction module component (TIGR02574 family)